MLNKLTTNTSVVHHKMHPWVYWDGWFSEEELQKIDEYCLSREMEKAKIHRPGSYVESMTGKKEEEILSNHNKLVVDYRESNISMCQANPENDWIFKKLFALVDLVNNNYFNFDLYGFNHFQYTEYVSGGKYHEHMDLLTGDDIPLESIPPRKLSCSLILSDNSDYTGGEFEFNYNGGTQKTIVEQKRGRFIFFPSFILHAVKPVITGKRRSIVAWVVGPKFK